MRARKPLAKHIALKVARADHRTLTIKLEGRAPLEKTIFGRNLNSDRSKNHDQAQLDADYSRAQRSCGSNWSRW